MDFYENWIDLDLNPILSFSSKGKILYSNQEAQFLLNRIKQKELYDLAITNASTSYGSKTTYLNLNLRNYNFYAITVYYNSEEEIQIKLYKATLVKKKKQILNKKASLNNIFTLIDLCISTKKTKTKITYKKLYDPSIPKILIIAAEFLKLLNSIYDSIQDATNITTVVKLKVGEYIKIEDKKVNLISVEIKSDGKFQDFNSDLDLDTNSFILTSTNELIIIDLPLLLK